MIRLGILSEKNSWMYNYKESGNWVVADQVTTNRTWPSRSHFVKALSAILYTSPIPSSFKQFVLVGLYGGFFVYRAKE
jgi:hypothetical protein